MIDRESINTKQAICILSLLIFGSSAIFGSVAGSAHDSWITLLAAMVLAAPFFIVFSRIIKLFPGSDIFDIALTVFGKIAGRIFILLYTLYSTYLGALVLRNFTEFVQVATKPETPQWAILIILIAAIVYLVFNGVQVLGKWSAVIMPIYLIIVTATVILAYQQMDFSNLFPIASSDTGVMADSAIKLFTFPFAETVLFLTITKSLKKSQSPYKIYMIGLLIGGAVMLIVFFRNLFVLGGPTMESELFPSYTTIRIVRVGTFLQRLESTISSNFYLGGITKIAVCLFGASIGTAKLLGIKGYKKALFPVAVIMAVLSQIVYKNIFEMLNGLSLYRWIALPFQTLLPIIICIGAEIKTRKDKKNMKPKQSGNQEPQESGAY